MELEKLVVRLAEKEKELAERKAKYKYANVESLQEEIRLLKKKIKKRTSINENDIKIKDRKVSSNKDLVSKRSNVGSVQQKVLLLFNTQAMVYQVFQLGNVLGQRIMFGT